MAGLDPTNVSVSASVRADRTAQSTAPEVAGVLHRDRAANGVPEETSGEPEVTLRIDRLRTGLRVAGEIDLITRNEWAKALDELADIGADLHLDLTGVTFIDVGGATLLARAAMRLADGHHLVLHRPPPILRSILDLLWGPNPAIEVRER
jgi:anti-anti-sigma factor